MRRRLRRAFGRALTAREAMPHDLPHLGVAREPRMAASASTEASLLASGERRH